MFIRVSSESIVYILFFSPLVLALIGFLITENLIFTFLCAGFGFALPGTVIKILQKRRIKKFEMQLIDALTSLSSSLKAGLSLLQAIQILVEELPPPISQEFSLILMENKLGVPLEKSLQSLGKRIKSEPLTLTIRAVLIARQTGGDLTAVFSQIVNTIREREKLERRMKTLTSQGKMQGALMGALPIIFALVVSTTNPSLVSTMLNDPIGQAMLVYGLISEIIGIILIRRICQIRV